MATQKYQLPGVALLGDFLDKHELSRAEFARMASKHGTRIDRVSIVQLIDGKITRVAVTMAVAIERATGGAVPVESWLPRSMRKAA